jgi:hypothetical protein
MKFTICEHKENSRVALLSEADDTKDWKVNGQVIEAANWQEAREQVDISNIWQSPYGEYYYV